MHMAYAVNQPVARVDIRVFDLAGRVVRTIERGEKGPGRYMVSWDGKDDQGVRARSGMYFLRASVGGQQKRVTITMLQ
jgi:flagellar hook assembly protein FlgD